jgi:cytochrome c
MKLNRQIYAVIALTLGLFLPVIASGAADRGTREEAQALVAKAVAAFNEKRPAVFDEINAGGFRNRDLYVFAQSTGPNGKVVAYGGPPVDPPVLGRPTADLKGAAGLPIGQMIDERATSEGTWVDYHWKDPATGETTEKSSWVVRAGDYIFGCGVYKVTD